MLIAHLSDPHLRPPGRLYQGLVDSNAMFDAALRAVAALDPAPDLVILSGDMVDEGEAEAYALAREGLAGLGAPVLAVPGNHDLREGFRDAFADLMDLPAAGPLHVEGGDHGPVRVLGLDISVPGAPHGEVDAAAAAWLEAKLAAEPTRPTLVMMHQPPFATGIAVIDPYGCRGAARLEAALRRHPQVERLLCGHVHRCVQARFGGTMALIAPSTTTSIALDLGGTPVPASYVEPPAMLLHHWREGRGLITHHLPIGAFPGPLPFF